MFLVIIAEKGAFCPLASMGRKKGLKGPIPEAYASPPMPNAEHPLVGVLMGSDSDWEETMSHASKTLDELQIPHEKRVTSAHRTPDVVERYASTALQRGIKVIIAGAGGAAHLPGIAAAQSNGVPVIGVPVPSKYGLPDSLLSIAQMPPEVAVATMAIGKSGAINAAILAAQILAVSDPQVGIRLALRRAAVRKKVEEADIKISNL